MPLINHAKNFAARVSNYLKSNKPALIKLTEEPQTPAMAIVSCADSRVNPAILGQAKPGEIFSISNIAGIIPPYGDEASGHHGTSAALQYAVEVLQVKDVVTLGHGGCGGILSLFSKQPAKTDKPNFVSAWMSIVTEARDDVLKTHSHLPSEDQARLCEEKAIAISLRNLSAYPFIKTRLENNSITLHGWHFDPRIGLRSYNAKTSQFELIGQKPSLVSSIIQERSKSAANSNFVDKVNKSTTGNIRSKL